MKEKLIKELRWWAGRCDRTNSGCQVRPLLEWAADKLESGVVREWIPVTERLPEDGQTVIACVTHRFGDKSIIPMVFWHESYFHWQDVTHWMPLPEPPKEVE